MPPINGFLESRNRTYGIILEKNFETWVKLNIVRRLRRLANITNVSWTYVYVVAGILNHSFITYNEKKERDS